MTQVLLFSGVTAFNSLSADFRSMLVHRSAMTLVVYYTLADASQAPDTKVRMSGERERDITSPV